MMLAQQLLGVVFAIASAGDRIKIDTAMLPPGRFVGADLRTRIFHGVNVVQKSFPWHPSTGSFDSNSSLNAIDMDNLASWGFNVVRLGVMWPGVEPAEQQYNHTYLQVMRQIVDDMYTKGIYTIVDFHQDAIAEKYCGEGLPNWLLPMLEPVKHDCTGWIPEVGKLIGQCKSFAEYNYSTDPKTGFPITSDCLKVTFDAYSRTPEVVSTWGNFYAYYKVQRKFQDFWRIVATAFKDSPGVLAYDLLNEPLNGDFFTHLEVMKPGYSDRVLLQPMYQALYEVIHKVDPAAIVMYEPAPFPDTYPSNIPMLHGVYSMGSTEGPAEHDYAYQALSYHIYSCGFADSNCDREGLTHDLHCPKCDDWAIDAVTKRTADARRLGGGVFLTEFGACREDPRCTAEIDRMTNSADAALTSWTYWQFKYNHDITTVAGPSEGFYTTDGQLQEKKVAALSRTYAPVIAGKPSLMKYERSTGSFRLVYTTEAETILLPTIIYLNEAMNYNTGGYLVDVLGATTKEVKKNQIELVATGNSATVDVVITRPFHGATAGSYVSKDGDHIAWQLIESKDGPGFHLKQEPAWWKMVKVIGDDGQVLCQLEIKDDIKSNHCVLTGSQKHSALFAYKIELWKAKTFGIHVHVDTIESFMLGPLVNKLVSFDWQTDAGKSEEMIV